MSRTSDRWWMNRFLFYAIIIWICETWWTWKQFSWKLMNERVLLAQHMRASTPRCSFCPQTLSNEVACVCFFSPRFVWVCCLHIDEMIYRRSDTSRFTNALRCIFFYCCSAKKKEFTLALVIYVEHIFRRFYHVQQCKLPQTPNSIAGFAVDNKLNNCICDFRAMIYCFWSRFNWFRREICN